MAEQYRTDGMTAADMRAATAAELIRYRIFQKVTSTVTVSDEEVRAFYHSNIDSYHVPTRREVREMLVPNQTLGRSLRRRLVNGADFCRLVRRYSLDLGSKQSCGELQVVPHQMVPSFDHVAFALPTDQLSKPIAGPLGYYLLEPMAAATPAGFIPLQQAEESIEERLLQGRKADVGAQWVKHMQRFYAGKIAYPSIYRSILRSVTAPVSTTASLTKIRSRMPRRQLPGYDRAMAMR